MPLANRGLPAWPSTGVSVPAGMFMGTPVYPVQNGSSGTLSLRGGLSTATSNVSVLLISNTHASTKVYVKIFDNTSTTIGNASGSTWAVAANMDILAPASTTLVVNLGHSGIRFQTTACRVGVSTGVGLTSAAGTVSSGDIIVQALCTP